MNILELNNLEQHLADHSDDKTLILLSSEGCHHCDEFETYLESIMEYVEGITMYRVNVTPETMPIFGPPVVPSIVGFEQSQRVLEGAGFPEEDTSVVLNLLTQWVNDEGFQYSAG